MKRRRAREYALQILFQLDIIKTTFDENLFKNFWEESKGEEDVKEFACALIKGTLEHLEEIDKAIEQVAEHWSLERMSVVDRNILRLATYELLHRNDIPPSVTINEAVEIAKKYGTEESSAFINGILDKIKELRNA